MLHKKTFSGEVNVTDSVSFQIKSHLWVTWTEIALNSEARAWEMRREGSAAENPADWIPKEMHPSLVGVAASSHALDGLYGDVIDDVDPSRSLRSAWADNGTKRPMVVLETLKQGFGVGSKAGGWVTEFKWLFEARDAAVHHAPKYTGGDPHPLAPGVTGSEAAFYRTENCSRATALLADVLQSAAANPKTGTSVWADQLGPTIQRLCDMWRVVDRSG